MIFAALAMLAASVLPAGSARAAADPNILFIVTDDQRAETLDVMPNTKALFEDQGTYFPNAYSTTPTCCPSRASIFTGLYAHNHGVKHNNQGPLLDHSLTLQRRLQETGYRTGIVGKVLNNWTITESPPFFDRWSIFNNSPYTNFRVNEQGEVKFISQYATTYVGQKAAEFITDAEQDDDQPWFLYVAPTAPHEPFTVETQYEDAVVPEFVSNPASFEADRSDKPPYIKSISPNAAAILDHRVAQLRMLMSVDDLVSDVFSALDAGGETDDTLAILISDNGYMWGEHGLEAKHLPYTHSVRIPMYLRWPDRLSSGVVDQRIAANIDLAPTALDAANLTPHTPMDGESLLQGQSRNRILLERPARMAGSPPNWASIRTPSVQYTEFYGAGSTSYVELSTPPAGPTISSFVPASPANNNSPRVRGTAAGGSIVRVYKAPTTDDCTPANLAATGTAASFASPGLTVSVPNDSATRFRATATDPAGNTSGCSTSHRTYTEDSTPPPAPNVTGTVPVSPANDNGPKVKGTAQAGATVRLYKAPTTADCTPANLAATGTAAEFAAAGIGVSVSDNSSTRFRATATDIPGNTSICSGTSRVYVEDSTPPGEPALTATLPVSPANENAPRVKGTAATGSIVKLYKAPTTADCTESRLAATGTAANFASPGLEVSVPNDSATRFRATATDAAGNTSVCSASSKVYTEDSTPPPGPSLTGTVPASPANDNAPLVKGTAQVGSTVRLYRAPTNADCTPANLAATGTAAQFASPGLGVSVPDNSVTRFRATATDAAGNTSVCSASSILYTEQSPQGALPSGRAHDGGSVLAHDGGSVLSGRSNGSKSRGLAARPRSGEILLASQPAAPVVEDTDPDSPANENSPRVKGTADAGSTVSLYETFDCSGAPVATGTNADFASPGLLVSVPDDSTTTFHATATDDAANVSSCSESSISYSEDSTAPAAPAVTDTDPDSPANENSPRIKGTAEAGSTVFLYDSSDCSGAPVATGTNADFASPGLLVSVPDDSTTTFHATATDDAANVSSCSESSIPYTEDSTAPPSPVMIGTEPLGPANANSPRVKGMAEAGSTVALYTTADCSGAAVATGAPTDFTSPGFLVSVPDDSVTVFRATATDGAGNVSDCSHDELRPGDQPVFREFYDLDADPWQLTNYLADANGSNDPSPQTLESLHSQLVSDLACAGHGGGPDPPACP